MYSNNKNSCYPNFQFENSLKTSLVFSEISLCDWSQKVMWDIDRKMANFLKDTLDDTYKKSL